MGLRRYRWFFVWRHQGKKKGAEHAFMSCYDDWLIVQREIEFRRIHPKEWQAQVTGRQLEARDKGSLVPRS